MGIKNVFKWRIVTNKYIYLTDETDSAPFILNKQTGERLYPTGPTSSHTSVDEGIIGDIVARITNASDYESRFNAMVALAQQDADASQLVFLSYDNYFNLDGAECVQEAITPICEGYEPVFNVSAYTIDDTEIEYSFYPERNEHDRTLRYNLNLGIPRGEKGDKGDSGVGCKGDKGADGRDSVIDDVQAYLQFYNPEDEPGREPSVTVNTTKHPDTNTYDLAFNFEIPQGEKGSRGLPGITGKQGLNAAVTNVQAAVIETLPAGSIPVVQVQNLQIRQNPLLRRNETTFDLNFKLPRGEKGDTGVPGADATVRNVWANTTTLDPDTSASTSVTKYQVQGENSIDLEFNFGIPRGRDGKDGKDGKDGADGIYYTFQTSVVPSSTVLAPELDFDLIVDTPTAKTYEVIFTYPQNWDGDTDTWRSIKVNNNTVLGTGTDTGALNLVQGNNITLTANGGNVTIEATVPDAMAFKGTLGVGGTIGSLPADGSADVGDTYKVITDGTYSGQVAKNGDLFICNGKTSSSNMWVHVPSGDEPSGTVTNITIGGGLTGNTNPITTSGVIAHAVSGVNTGTYGPTADVTGTDGTTIKIPEITVDQYGHITSATERTYTSKDTDEHVTSAANHYGYTSGSGKAEGLYKIATDDAGHVTSATTVQKSDITALGIPGEDTNTHREIQLGGATILSTSSTTPLNFVGNGISITDDGAGTLTFSGTTQTITLNGSAVTNPSFYAPTSGGTSGQYLQSQGDGNEPQWVNLPTPQTVNDGALNIKYNDGNTDISVATFTANQSSGTTITFIGSGDTTITGDTTAHTITIGSTSGTNVPKKKNELIYSDDEETLTTHELMFTGGLVVDTGEDLDLCKAGADMSMSDVLDEWIAYGYSGTTQARTDVRSWGYCDSTGSGTTQDVYLIGAIDAENPEFWKTTVPVFKYNGSPQDYIFNTRNTIGNTGYYSSEKYSSFDSTITCGVLPSMQHGDYQDYMAIVPAITTINDVDNVMAYNYGISIHVENEYISNSDGHIDGRPRYTSGGNNLDQSTIIITAWKQDDLNTLTNSSGTTNINILNASDGMSIISYVSELNNGKEGTGNKYIKTSCMQTRTIRNGNIITFYISDPYPVYKSHYNESSTEVNNKWVMDGYYSNHEQYGGDEFIPNEVGGEIYNDDYDFKDTIHYERPIIINLDSYTIRYVREDGTTGINDFTTNSDVVEIFNALKGSAHRGFECESNPGTFFRNSSVHERIIDVTPGENKVYDYDGSRWNWSFNTSDSSNMPTITVNSEQYTLQTATVAGAAKYQWINSNASPTVYYTEHPVPEVNETAYESPDKSGNSSTITSVDGVKLLPQVVFENGSRIAWNRITDKLFYNDGVSIYRIAASNGGGSTDTHREIQVSGETILDSASTTPLNLLAGSGINITCTPGTPYDVTISATNTTTIPVGSIQMYAGSTAPTGWLLCDGSPVPSGSTYDNLRNVLGSTYGGFYRMIVQLQDIPSEVEGVANDYYAYFDNGYKFRDTPQAVFTGRTETNMSNIKNNILSALQTFYSGATMANLNVTMLPYTPYLPDLQQRFPLGSKNDSYVGFYDEVLELAYDKTQQVYPYNYVIIQNGKTQQDYVGTFLDVTNDNNITVSHKYYKIIGFDSNNHNDVKVTACNEYMEVSGTATELSLLDDLLSGSSEAGRLYARKKYSTDLGSTGGNQTVRLDVAEMPAHSHKVMVDTDGTAYGDATHPLNQTTQEENDYSFAYTTGINNKNIIQTTGGSQAHNNIPQFLAINYIIKY